MVILPVEFYYFTMTGKKDHTTDDLNNPPHKSGPVCGRQVDYEQFDINPVELETVIRNSWKDSVTNIQYVLAKLTAEIPEDDWWICYSIEQGNDGKISNIIAIGQLYVNYPQLNFDQVVSYITERAREVPANTSEQTQAMIDIMLKNPESHVRHLDICNLGKIKKRVWEALENGTALTDGSCVWVSTKPNEYDEVVELFTRSMFNTSDDLLKTICLDVLRNHPPDRPELPEAIQPTKNVGELQFKTTPAIIRTIEIHQQENLDPQIALAIALYEYGRTKDSIAEVLDISLSEVDEYISYSCDNVE